MSYEPDDGGMFAKMSGKRLAILFGLAFFGVRQCSAKRRLRVVEAVVAEIH